MAQIEIYTSPLCGFCHAAKRLLNDKGVSFSEIDVARDGLEALGQPEFTLNGLEVAEPQGHLARLQVIAQLCQRIAYLLIGQLAIKHCR